MSNITAFETNLPHLYVPAFVIDPDGTPRALDAILDTGAPHSEFSDQFLQYAGLLGTSAQDVQIKPGLQTQKYGKIMIPRLKICGHQIQNMKVYVSHFEKHWGVDALIGLDFFRQFRVIVDYKAGQIITESFV